MFEMDFHIRYSETDRSGRLSMEGLLRLFQDVGYIHAEGRGLGVKFSERTRRTFYLLTWDIEALSMPCLGQEVKIQTYFYYMSGPTAKKSIVMKDAEGNILATGDTLWVYMDIDKQIPADIPSDLWPKDDFGEKIGMMSKLRRIPKLDPGSQNVTSVSEIILKPYLLDMNEHANNTRLTLLAMSLCGADNGCRSLRAEFKEQIKSGSIIHPYIFKDESTIVALKDENGKDYAVFAFV